MEALFCGPARKINMVTLKEKGNNELYKVITDALNSEASILLQSKADPKIRNYGINQSELYQLVKNHKVQIGANDY